MKGHINYAHIILSISIAFVMIVIVSGLAFGVLWYFENYVEDNLDPSNNIVTKCIGQCQAESVCEAGTVSSYKLINGSCNCECVTAKENMSSSSPPDGWEKFVNNKYSFQFYYPTNEYTTPEVRNEVYTRIQNYSSEEDTLALLPGEYYLEINIWDKSDSPQKCEKQMQDSTKVSLGNNTGYRGGRLPGGDQGGVGFVICAETDDKKIWIQVTGEDESGNIANGILDTFQFVEKELDDDDNDSNWQQYAHEDFVIQYPAGWEARADSSGSELALEAITFSAPEIESDSLWSILLYNTNSTSQDALIAKMGEQFSDRKEIRERITISGEQATKATVTTDLITGWSHTQIFLEYGDTLYAINDGARAGEGFDTFYEYFQLTTIIN